MSRSRSAATRSARLEKFEQKSQEAKEAGEELSPEELVAQAGESLPDPEAMSLVDANVAAPVNPAVAANILSEDSTATASAEQNVDIDQSNE